VITDSNFYKVGELLILDIHKFGGTTQLTESQVDERFGEDKDVLKGIQDLLLPEDRNLLDALQQIKNEVFGYVYRSSVPSDIPQFHWIRKTDKAAMIDYLNGAKQRFKEVAEEFGEKWAAIETRFAETKPNLYRPEKYPSKADLLSRFVFIWKWKEIMPSEDGSEELKSEIGRMKNWVLRALKKAIADRMEVLAKSCADGKVNQATLKSIDSQIFERVDTVFNGFIDSSKVREAIGDLQEYLDGTDAEMLRADDDFRQMIEKKAKEVASTVSKVKEEKDDRALIF
jgi:hypothetical protein